MADTATTIDKSLRMSADELKRRMEAGEPVTVLDDRNPHAWASSDLKIRGAERLDPGELRVDPNWPKDRLTVVY